MTGPQSLSRPLARRVHGLPEPSLMMPGPDLPSAVIEAGIAALDAGKTHYTDRPGILPLRQRVVEMLQHRFGLTWDPDHVTITCGATEARFAVIKQLARPGSAILCPGDPALIVAAAQLAGVTVVPEAPDPAAISLAVLTPAVPPETAAVALRPARAHGWWVLWDISGPSRGTYHPAADPALANQVVTIGSFSGQMPGWRVGWMAGSQKAGELRALKQSMTICSTSVAQWAALGLVEDV